ncbi:hypothetical protein ACFPMF_10080 [Larkinella bovis]|uniref:Transposase IS701-like DDE domain-containing protein n=1 Tax=Larkinella bovis TaxID=683041 RepID=A0ABW0IE85_9BACT
MSELGGKLLGEQHAPAATKRISNLLRSKAWSHTLIEAFLLEKAQNVAQQLQDQPQVGVLIWDESVIEKSESIRSEGVYAVRSSKAKRLKGSKPGFLNPPGGRPVPVPGFEWMGLLLAGLKTHPCIAFFRWYTPRGNTLRTAYCSRPAYCRRLLRRSVAVACVWAMLGNAGWGWRFSGPDCGSGSTDAS